MDATKAFAGRLRMDLVILSAQDLGSCTVDAYSTIDSPGAGFKGKNSVFTQESSAFTVSDTVDGINSQTLTYIQSLQPKKSSGRGLAAFQAWTGDSTKRLKGPGGKVELSLSGHPLSRATQNDPGVRLGCVIIAKKDEKNGGKSISSLVSTLLAASSSNSTLSLFTNLKDTLAANNPPISISSASVSVLYYPGTASQTSAGLEAATSLIPVIGGVVGGVFFICAAVGAYFYLRNAKCARRRAGFVTVSQEGGAVSAADQGISSPVGGDAGVGKASSALTVAREALKKLKSKNGRTSTQAGVATEDETREARDKASLLPSENSKPSSKSGSSKSPKLEGKESKSGKKSKREHSRKARSALLVESTDEEDNDAHSQISIPTKQAWSGEKASKAKGDAPDNDVTSLGNQQWRGIPPSTKVTELDSKLEQEFSALGAVGGETNQTTAPPAGKSFTPTFDPGLAAKYGGAVAAVSAAAAAGTAASGLGAAPGGAPRASVGDDIWDSLPRPASAGLGSAARERTRDFVVVEEEEEDGGGAGEKRKGGERKDKDTVVDLLTSTLKLSQSDPFHEFDEGGDDERSGRINTEAEIQALAASMASTTKLSPVHTVIQEKLSAVEAAVASALAAQEFAESQSLAASQAAAAAAQAASAAITGAGGGGAVTSSPSGHKNPLEDDEEDTVVFPSPTPSPPAVSPPTDHLLLISPPSGSSRPPSSSEQLRKPRGGGWLSGIGAGLGSNGSPQVTSSSNPNPKEEDDSGINPLPPPPSSLPPPSVTKRQSSMGGGGLSDTLSFLGLGGATPLRGPHPIAGAGGPVKGVVRSPSVGAGLSPPVMQYSPADGHLPIVASSPVGPLTLSPIKPPSRATTPSGSLRKASFSHLSPPALSPPSHTPVFLPAGSPPISMRPITPTSSIATHHDETISPSEGPAMESVRIESLKPVRGGRRGGGAVSSGAAGEPEESIPSRSSPDPSKSAGWT